MSYGSSQAEVSRRAAYYVDKILRGAEPADLPIAQPTEFELAINVKTAKQIGATIPRIKYKEYKAKENKEVGPRQLLDLTSLDGVKGIF